MSVELGTNAIGRDGGWHWESDRAIRALKPGNAGRAKGPDFRHAVEEAAEGDIGESLFKPHADPKVSEAALSPGEAVAETTAWTRRRSRSESPVREIRTPGLMSGDGKRDHELYAQSTRAHPRLYFGPGTSTVYTPPLRITSTGSRQRLVTPLKDVD